MSINTTSNISIPTPNRADGWVPGPRDIAETPGGNHICAVTPGGTKLMWTREQMKTLAHSPMARSPLDLPEGLSFLGKDAPKFELIDTPIPEPVKNPEPVGVTAQDDGGLFHMES